MGRTAAGKQARSAGGAQTLPRQYYTDADLFALERERVFARHWSWLAHACDLKSPRSFVATDLIGAPVLLMRDDRGTLRGFHNVCRHRGAQLECRPHGLAERSTLLCPYHGWSYELDGRLAGAPNMMGVESFRREDWGLKPFEICEWQGAVLGAAAQPSSDLTTALNTLGDQIAPWGCESLTRAATLNYEVRANWKILFENYSECYHCPLVHPALNRLTPYSASANAFQQGPVLGGPMALADGVETMSTTGRALGAALPKLTAELRRQVHYFTVFPSFFLSLHPDYVMVHRLQPLAVDRTRVLCEFYVAGSDSGKASVDPQAAVEFWDVTNRQDWHVCELVQRGAASPAFSPGPMSDLESIVAAFDGHYLAVMRDAAT